MPHETKAARIIRLAQDGLDYGEIATAVGSTRRSVRDHGVICSKIRNRYPQRPCKMADNLRQVSWPYSWPEAACDRAKYPTLGTTGVCVLYLICAARRRGVDIPSFPVGSPRRFAATNATIIRMAKSGMHVGDIAAAVGATSDAIRPILSAARKQDVDIPRQNRENPDRAAVIALAGTGMRPCAIAAQLGIRRRKMPSACRMKRRPPASSGWHRTVLTTAKSPGRSARLASPSVQRCHLLENPE